MSKTITITLPEAYEEPAFIVLVSKEKTGSSGYPSYVYGVTVLDDEGEEVEEIGESASLTSLMTDVSRLIRTGSTVTAKEREAVQAFESR